MQTPAGKECSYFYGDYHRGKNIEECRLLKDQDIEWEAYLCNKCPVPDIFQANACENMKFTVELRSPFVLMKPRVEVSTYCVKCECNVEQPKIGCGQCHPLLDIFVVGPNDENLSD